MENPKQIDRPVPEYFVARQAAITVDAPFLREDVDACLREQTVASMAELAAKLKNDTSAIAVYRRRPLTTTRSSLQYALPLCSKCFEPIKATSHLAQRKCLKTRL